MALKADGTVWAWGRNAEGQLGDGTTTNRSTPVPVSGLSGVTAVAVGAYHTVALKLDGTVWALGSNSSGQLGDGTTTNRSSPVQVSGLSSVTAVAAGGYHTVALKSNGTVWACGLNNGGQLGDTTTISRSMPVQTSGFSLSPMCGPRAVCDAGTGTCLALPGANGMVCDDSDACTQTDLCQAGICVGASPVTCAVLDQCHDAGTCDTATGLCSTPAKLDGSSCDDANPCTQTDVCQTGTCTGSNPVVCAALDACHAPGSCDPQSGTCSTPAKPSGTLCAPAQCSGSTLNTSQVCDGNGVCQAGSSQDCAPFGCAAGACLMSCTSAAECAPGALCVGGVCAFAECANPLKPDGTGCDDGNACTQLDTCQSGACVGSTVMACPSGECGVGSCNPASGACQFVPKQDHTPCVGGICIAGGCYIEAASSSASSSSSGSGGDGSGATGSSGSTAASTSATGTTSTTTGAGAGAGGSAGEITLHGGACAIGRSSSTGAPWIGLGLLLTLRRRRRQPSRCRSRH